MICWLFRSELFSLHMLESLIVFLLWLRSNLTALLPEKMLGMISLFFFFFDFIKVRFMAQDVIYPGEGSVRTWGKGEIDCFGVIVFSFSFVSMHILIYFSFLLWFVPYSAACYSASICWNFYWFLSCDWDLILLHCGQKRCLEWFQFFFF